MYDTYGWLRLTGKGGADSRRTAGEEEGEEGEEEGEDEEEEKEEGVGAGGHEKGGGGADKERRQRMDRKNRAPIPIEPVESVNETCPIKCARCSKRNEEENAYQDCATCYASP